MLSKHATSTEKDAMKSSKIRKKKQKMKRRATVSLEKAKTNGAFNRLVFENGILKEALKSSRQKLVAQKRQSTSVGQNQHGTSRMNKRNHSQIAKDHLVKHFPSMPQAISGEHLIELSETKFSGTFGTIFVCEYTKLEIKVACKKISREKSTSLDIEAEAKVCHALGGHPYFPYCVGFIAPNCLVMQLLGTYDINGLTVVTLDKAYKRIGKTNLLKAACQLLEAIEYMHNVGLLHNDLKLNNIVLHGTQLDSLKVIDFGKVTLISNPVTYNLNLEEQIRYNAHHSYLAYELRNVPNTKQSVLTDTFSVGYCLKHIGYDCVPFLYETGRKMKAQLPCSRLRISSALSSIKVYVNNNNS